MNFPTAVRTCLRKYATFSGVASRSEYWYFALFNFVGSFVFGAIGFYPLRVLWGLALLIPGLAVGVRRLHDTGRSAWWLLTGIIFPWFIILACLPGKLTNNPYAPDRSLTEDGASITEADLSGSGSHCTVCGKLRLPGQSYCVGCGTKFPD